MRRRREISAAAEPGKSLKITVRDLLNHRMTVLAGRSGLRKVITLPQIWEPDVLSLEGKLPAAGGVLHLPPSQVELLCSQTSLRRRRLLVSLINAKPACIMISGGRVCDEMLDAASAGRIPLLKCGAMARVSRFLAERAAAPLSLHGVLVQIFGLGTLIIGESAVGKSEAALDLVLRGHKLIADDIVLVKRKGREVRGYAADMGKNLLQIRGLGIVDIRALYGESATLSEANIGLVVELEEWRKGRQYSLVGLRERRHRLLGINIPYLKLPVKTGRNMATIIEVAARNQLLKNRGIFTARSLNRKLLKRLSE